MSKGIAELTVKHGRALSLIVAAISIGIIGAYVTYPYSSSEQALVAKISRTAAAAGLADWFGAGTSTSSDSGH